jgi:putative ABC transport system permease protein
MLQLKNIKKDYLVANAPIPALNGIDLSFQKKEFVSILGPSGCGKTTLLNLIGGLDRYTSGDLLIDNKSTKNFTDSDWDAYRNATIGFVFQNYNLISHLSVLDNVEIALRLSGVGAKERKERAIKVLTEVGLEEHITKRPNQLSGGQMQRVAIARALVNNPKILLADEPTGALDSKTSEQIMKLIQKISKNRLVIMVTHNADIAKQYSDRIIKLLDGKVIEDSKPVQLDEKNNAVQKLQNKKTSMSYVTAIKTSFKNLLTKKGRTIITSIAGSIGIIGIALVLAISSGMTTYVNNMQSDTLSGFPIQITQTVTDFSSFQGPMQENAENEFPEEEVIYSYDRSQENITHTNNITEDYLTYLSQMDASWYNDISYGYSMELNVVTKTSLNSYIKVPTSVNNIFFTNYYFSELPNNEAFVASQYEVIDGTYPTNKNEALLVVDSQNRVEQGFLQAIGLSLEESYTFDSFLGKVFRLIPNDVYYSEVGGNYVAGNNYQAMYENVTSVELEIVGIMRVREDAASEILNEGVLYTSMLTQELLNNAQTSQIAVAQTANTTTNLLTGQPFNLQVTHKSVLKQIGATAVPTNIQIYPVSFDKKDQIKNYLSAYNQNKLEAEQILYTDLAEAISSTISSLINTITIILGAFAGISLVVSSIMIGIITYVSVVERTKEIGIMRSLGARKKDISRIFNAETILIGFAAGLFGIMIAGVLTLPINLIIERFIEVKNFSNLPLQNAVSLLVLSTILTLIAGLIPSKIASRKDPVVALRTE